MHGCIKHVESINFKSQKQLLHSHFSAWLVLSVKHLESQFLDVSSQCPDKLIYYIIKIKIYFTS